MNTLASGRPLLEVQHVLKRYGGLVAVNDVSLELYQNEILSIIGPNGAGKSTLFKLIAGAVTPNSGAVFLEGQKLTGKGQHDIAKMGVVRSFQETTIFKEMTALEHVLIAHHLQVKASTFGIFRGSLRAKRDEHEIKISSQQILEYLGLGHVANESAKSLPHGYLRALGMAMALAAKPRVLLLDEPFAGMNPEETDRAVQMVRGIRAKGISVILVEHDMRAVMQISDRIVALSFGQKIAEGLAIEIQHHPAVIEAYLGKEDDELGV